MRDMKGFIDFEFNNSCKKMNEIISIGCIVLNDDLQEIATFSFYVKLKDNIIIEKFVSELTGITQEDIDNADDFETVSKRFVEFAKPFGKIEFFCWGNIDNKALLDTCKINDCYMIKDVIKNITNIQSQICASIKNNGNIINSRFKLDLIRRFYGLPERKTHDSLEDALVLADIYKAYITRGVFNYPNGFKNDNLGVEIANEVINEILEKVGEKSDEYFKDNSDRCNSLIDFLEGKLSLKVVLNRSIYDTCKRYFYGKHGIVSESDIDVFSIEYDELDKYTLSAKIDKDNNTITFIMSEGILNSIVTLTTNKKNRKYAKNVLKKMKEVGC